MTYRSENSEDTLPPALRFLSGGGEAARRIRERCWDGHVLGRPEAWPDILKSTLSTILNSPESLILAWGRDDLTFFFNDAYARLLGPRVEWAMGSPFREVWADAWEQAKPIIDDAFVGRSQRFVDLPWKLSTDRGAADTWFTFSYSRVLDPDGEVAGLFILTNETTAQVLAEAERRDAERRLRASEGRLRDFADTLEQQVATRTAERDRMWNTSPDLMVEASLEGVYQRANPAWRPILGYDPDEVVGTTAADYTHPDDIARMLGGLETAQADTLPSLNLRFRHKDGSYRWIQWVAASSVGMIFAIGRDVTRAVEAEEQLRRTEEALRHSQKMEAVGQLTGGVAHDFNNLLTIIRSSVDFLRRPDLPAERRERYLDAASETVDRAAKLTGQLLAFARRQALKPETFDVIAQVRAVADMLDTVTGARVRIITDLPAGRCHVRADVSQFETALVNMAVNARDAMHGEGVVTLSVACHAALPAIRGHAGSRERFTAITVADTGVGIAADQLSRIFEPFYTTKEVGKGTGLGLSQVFGFAKQSGGDIAVASTPGAGASFTLYLPEITVEGDAGAEEAVAAEGVLKGAGQCILVVEDNVELGRFCTHILEDLGYRTALAANAEEAIERLGRDGAGFDAVFSDVVMPGMGGLALARVLRDRMPTMPVVLASGYSHVLAREDDHGFELLHKPYSAAQVAEALFRVMRRAGRVG